MLTKKIFEPYITALLNVVFLSLIGVLLNYIFFPKHFYMYGSMAIVFQYLFFIILIYVFYTIIITLIPHKSRIKMVHKAILTGLAGVIILVFLGYAASGLIPVKNLQYLSGLAVIFCLGFLLPFSHQFFKKLF